MFCVDDLLDDLADAKWFSTIDLASGYWQVEVSPEDQEKTAFTTPHGLYQFKVMPFGLCNAPSTFQRLMELVLAGLRWDMCLAYLDDIIVFGRTFPEHLERLYEVFSRLQQANLKINSQKCQFFRKSVTFLGHKVSHEGISTDPEKTNSIRNWPIPTDTHELKSFLGLASYYRRFIPNFAEITAPMAQLTQKKEIVWTEECIRSFETIKKKLTNAPVLGFPSQSEKFYLDTDASNNSIGAVLSQIQNGQEKVIAYGSRTLTKAEKNYSVTRKELLALVYFMQHFRYYLLGRPFVARTDHAALQWIQGFKHPEGQLARWLEQLQELIISSVSPIPCYNPPEIRDAQYADSTLRPVFDWFMSGARPATPEGLPAPVQSLWAEWKQLEMDPNTGILYRKWESDNRGLPSLQLIVPQQWTAKIIQSLHNGCGGGHLGFSRTLSKLQERFHWFKMKDDVDRWCKECHLCASGKSPPKHRRAPLKTSKVGNPMMERIAAIPNQEAPTVANKLVNEWICRYGAPNSIHTDQGRNFESHLFSEICDLLDIKKTQTSPYHPQSDGLVERMNRTILMMLTVVLEKYEDWEMCLPTVMLAYRASVHETTGFTPFKLMFSREIRLPVDVMFGRPPDHPVGHSHYVNKLREGMERIFSQFREKTKVAQKRQKDHYDSRVFGGRYKIGEVPSSLERTIYNFRCFV